MTNGQLSLRRRVHASAHRGLVLGSRRLAPVLLPLNTVGGRGYHRGVPPSVPVQLYCVYRARNADLVRRLVAGLPAGSAAHLHALDAVCPALAEHTRSGGPGERMALLNRLLAEHPPAPGRPVLVTDDDVCFVGAGAARFGGFATLGGFDIAQPAHQPGSEATFFVTRVVPLSTARETRFVEVGPVVFFAPRVLPRVLPFPADSGMGWGLDVAWSLLRAEGFRLGVVDATPVVHHGPVGAAYDTAAADAAQREHLRRAGVGSAHELATNVGRTWRPWQRLPRWPAQPTPVEDPSARPPAEGGSTPPPAGDR